jgi:hypothetical protein
MAAPALPVLTCADGPTAARAAWQARLLDEYKAIIEYQKSMAASDSSWFKLAADASGCKWSGSCWYYHKGLRYELPVVVEVSEHVPQHALRRCAPKPRASPALHCHQDA